MMNCPAVTGGAANNGIGGDANNGRKSPIVFNMSTFGLLDDDDRREDERSRAEMGLF